MQYLCWLQEGGCIVQFEVCLTPASTSVGCRLFLKEYFYLVGEHTSLCGSLQFAVEGKRFCKKKKDSTSGITCDMTWCSGHTIQARDQVTPLFPWIILSTIILPPYLQGGRAPVREDRHRRKEPSLTEQSH